MRNKISVIIIDSQYLVHDYSEIKTNYGPNREKYFEIKILDSSNNILEKINEFKGFDCLITIGDHSQWDNLCELSFDFRKKWVHMDEFIPSQIVNSILEVFKGNINRPNEIKLFSIFTCTFNTEKAKLNRLYNSLKNQTYKNWNWFILDDSTNDSVQKYIDELKDPRITMFKNVSNHGNIGFNKHMIAMACNGDYLVEVDHDDELTNDCLHYLNKAFEEFPESDFVYSRCLELAGGTPIIYADGWGWREGLTVEEVVNGTKVTYSESPLVNPYSIRTIYAQPNHVRCWKKEFYHKIGGHNPELSVLDDMDLLIRTFLFGKMTMVQKCLYIQYQGEGPRGLDENNTQSTRFAEIQRTVILLKQKYDKQVHDRIIELGFKDDPWNEEGNYSYLGKEHIPGQNIMCNKLQIYE